MRDMLEQKLNRFEELERLMSDPDVLADSNRMAAIAREHGSLAKLANRYRSFKNVVDEIGEVSEMATSSDAEERATDRPTGLGFAVDRAADVPAALRVVDLHSAHRCRGQWHRP